MRTWLPAVCLAGLFVLLGVYYSVTTPIWEAPDETGHFGNVYYIARNGRLPGPGTFYTWHQSPLYHVLAAQLVRPISMSPLSDWRRSNPQSATASRGREPNIDLHSVRELPPYRDVALAVHLARWLNVAFGAATVVLTYALARRLFPGQVWVAVGAAGLVAFNPQFLFMSAAVQNDVPLAMAFALTLLPALNIVQGDWRLRQFLWLGGMAGLAIVFKQSGVVLVGLVGLVVLWATWQSRRWANLPLWGAVAVLGLLLVAGPMYLRNTVLYGDPFAYWVYKSLHPPVAPLSLSDLTGEMVLSFFRGVHRSFWGYFGWLTVPLPAWIYQALWLLYPLALLGLALWLLRGRTTWAQPAGGLPAVALLPLGILLVWAFTIRYTLSFGPFGVQGRYLFQMMAAQAILLSLGLFAWPPGRWRGALLAGVLLALLALAAWAPGSVIAPRYAYLGDSPQVLDTVQFRRGEILGQSIELAGYNTSIDRASGRISLSLYWRTLNTPAEDYTVFVHLLDGQGNRMSQDDRRPLDGRFPTDLWRAGDVMHTDHVLQASQACLRSVCYLAVGFYDLKTGRRLPVTQGAAEGDAVLLREWLP